MNLKKLLSGVEILKNFKNYENLDIEGIEFNSKKNLKNKLFFALKGTNTDGHNFANEAIKNGAIAIVCEKFLDINFINQIVVKSSRIALAQVSANFFGNPAKGLDLIGVTGTNGKTTITHVLKAIFQEAGLSVGIIGTLGYYINEKHFKCDMTTPDPLILHKIFSQMKNKGVKIVVMEVSAHAIALEKIYGLDFKFGVLTNITQDHLDFFTTMENYRETKFKFLNSPNIKSLVLNADDPSYAHLQNLSSISYGIKNPSDSFAIDISLKIGSSQYVLNVLDNIIPIKSNLSGLFNVYNVLAASTISILMGIKMEIIKEAINNLLPIEGRFNVINTNRGKIIVDFAHTPDGLQNILKSVRELSKDKLICVFGCNGNRDQLKRPIMGRIAEELCDEIILTSDNPRFENPLLICDDILEGVVEKEKFKIETDRKKAIELGLCKLDKKSILVICGKGGEKYQDINGINVPYDDFEEVEKGIKKLQMTTEG